MLFFSPTVHRSIWKTLHKLLHAEKLCKRSDLDLLTIVCKTNLDMAVHMFSNDTLATILTSLKDHLTLVFYFIKATLAVNTAIKYKTFYQPFLSRQISPSFWP